MRDKAQACSFLRDQQGPGFDPVPLKSLDVPCDFGANICQYETVRSVGIRML